MNMSTILRLNEKSTIALIQGYKNEECLWNTHLDDYPNRHKRSLAADKIAKMLDIPNFEGHHVMFKFKNLRNSYCQELKKIAGAKLEGRKHVPKLVWFKLMDSFIKPHLQISKPPNKPGVKKKTTNHNFAQVNLQQADITDIKTETELEMELMEDSEVPQDQVSVSSETSSSSDQDSQNSLDNVDPPDREDKKEDCFDSFGKYVSSLLRTLPTANAMALQPKIVNLIVKEIQAQSNQS